MNTKQLKAIYKLLTGKDSAARTKGGVLKEIADGIEVTIDGSTKVLTIKAKA